MSQELLYTSAPEGLNPSDQGFCTVACTQGMPRNLKELLENLSGYRQADQPPHPVNYSHLVHTVGGKRYHILSRVSDYEKDYSGRTNKLAHHVALMTTQALPNCGPAALLQTPLMQSRWDGQTRWIPQGPILPAAAAYQGLCRNWEAITGDAGWAGVLAESAADSSPRPMYVIFPAGLDALALVQEALTVLPREKAWTTSFSTYFTKLPAGVDCLWRFVLDGSPEAKQARAASHSRIIDLVDLQRTRRRAPEGNPYVEAARTGRVAEAVGGMSPASTHAAPSALAATATAPMASSATHASPFAPSQTAVPASPFGKPSGGGEKSSKLPLILGGSALVLVLGIGALVYSMLNRDVPAPVETADTKPERRKTKLPPPKLLIAEKQLAHNEALANKATNTHLEHQPVKPNDDARPKNGTNNAPKGPAVKGPWDRTLTDAKGVLALPKNEQSLDLVKSPEPERLTEVHVVDPTEIDLKIFSPNGDSESLAREDAKKDGFVIEVEDQTEPDGTSRRIWLVKRKIIDRNTSLPKFYDVAVFELADQVLTFLWKDSAIWVKANSLQFCLLEIQHDEGSHRFRLSKAEEPAALSYDVSKRDQELLLDVKSAAIDNPDSLFLDLALYVGGKNMGSKKGLHREDKATFNLDRGVEFDLVFKYDDDNGPFLLTNSYTNREVLVSGFEKALSNRPVAEVETIDNRLRENVDKILIEKRRQPTILGDLERLPKKSKLFQERLDTAAKLRNHRAEVERLTGLIKREKNAEARADLTNQRAPHLEGISKYEERIEVAASWDEWSQEMKPYFEELAQNAKVSYSIYTVIDGEKIFLAQSKVPETPASSKEPKNEGGNEKPRNKDGKKPNEESAKKNYKPVAEIPPLKEDKE